MDGQLSILVNSLCLNMETLLGESVPRSWAQIYLGTSWKVDDLRGALSEYAWPSQDVLALLRNRSGIVITRESEHSGSHLLEHLASGRPAIAAVDSYYLPYRPAFRQVHSGRTLIVRADPSSRKRVLVDDPWPPIWQGAISLSAFEKSRCSCVPMEMKREPVFAGVPIDECWWQIGPPPRQPLDAQQWLVERLADLHRDAAGVDGTRCLPAEALDSLALLLRQMDSSQHEPRRNASLYLRAVVSARAYMLALVRAAANLLQDAWLGLEAERYVDGLKALAQARDLLIKSLVSPRPQYERLIHTALNDGAEAERRLAVAIYSYGMPFTKEMRLA